MTRHGEQRLIQRSIKKDELEKALNDPDYSYPGKCGEMNFVKTLPGGRAIRVVAEQEKGRIKIITAMTVKPREEGAK